MRRDPVPPALPRPRAVLPVWGGGGTRGEGLPSKGGDAGERAAPLMGETRGEGRPSGRGDAGEEPPL